MSTEGLDGPKSSAPGGTLGTLGAYQLIEQFPRSRETEEYVARQRGPGGFERICLLKLARRNRADLRGAEMLEREAKVLMRLDHPSIVRFHDFFEHEDKVVLVLEHFSGLTLARFLELLRENNEPLDERITWHVALTLFEALAHAHGLGDGGGESAPVVHRDVRPGNILVSSNGRIRLTGFSAAQDGDTKEDATALGEIVQVPSYVAPEQVRGSQTTEGSDAFSAALIVWEMLTRQSATPEGLSEFDLLKALSIRHPDSLRALRPDIPALVTTALDLCLMPNPQERRIHCEEVAGCISAGLPPGDGVHALRDTIARLGPAVEKLAGGKANSGPPSRRPGSTPPLPHRPEAITLPDRVRISARMEAAVTAIPRAPGSRPSLPSVPGALSDLIPADGSPRVVAYEANEIAEREALEAAREAGEQELIPEADDVDRVTPVSPLPAAVVREMDRASSPAPATTRTDPPAPANPIVDDDLDQMRASQKRRQVVRMAVLGVPVLATAVILVVALAGGFQAGSAAPPLPAIVPTPAETTPDKPSHDRVPEPEPAKSGLAVVAAPADQAVLIVQGPPSGFVYVMGKPIGSTGVPILTECGQRYLRVGTEMGSRGMSTVRWLAGGRSVQLRCGKTTTVAADPARTP